MKSRMSPICLSPKDFLLFNFIKQTGVRPTFFSGYGHIRWCHIFPYAGWVPWVLLGFGLIVMSFPCVDEDFDLVGPKR